MIANHFIIIVTIKNEHGVDDKINIKGALFIIFIFKAQECHLGIYAKLKVN